MSRKEVLCLALGLMHSLLASGCVDNIPGNQGSPLPESRRVEVPHPMQGLWQGSLSQSIPEAAERSFFGLITPDGEWLFAAFDEALPTDQAPFETIWALEPFTDQQSYNFSGDVFDASDVLRDWGASGMFEEALGFSGEYRVYQGGFGSPALTERGGTFAVEYGLEYEIGSSVEMIAGDYASETLSVSINAHDEVQAQIAGTGDSGSQIGSCTFSGLIAPIDTRFNAYRGTADLRQERCDTAGDPAYSLLAYLISTSDCEPTASKGPNALVLALRNGVTGQNNGSRSHYFHRLCRTKGALT